jgi:hypothetical protein
VIQGARHTRGPFNWSAFGELTGTSCNQTELLFKPGVLEKQPAQPCICDGSPLSLERIHLSKDFSKIF